MRLAAIVLFMLLYLAATLFWRVPAWVAGVYGLMSLVAFVAYAIDKSAAKSAGSRISESTLLVFGLVGGWPGAIIAQQLLRHKSSKVSFRVVFWFTVVVNVTVFIFLSSPTGRHLLRW
ncbi:MAG: DNA-binding protein [Betaproteobacteria bacterium]|nr:DNA-binding protein [Betaproteobacteria bacterium]